MSAEPPPSCPNSVAGPQSNLQSFLLLFNSWDKYINGSLLQNWKNSVHIEFQKTHPQNVPEPSASHGELTSSAGFTTVSPVIMDIAATMKKQKNKKRNQG